MFPDIPRRPSGGTSEHKGFLVAELAPGMVVTGQAAVARCEKRQTRAGKPFLALELSDRTGRVDAKDFDRAAEHEAVLTPGAVVKVKGKVDEFNGQLQLVIEKARPAREEEIDRADFVPATRYDVEAMFGALRAHVEAVRDPWVRQLLLLMLERHGAALRTAPAAMRLHHAFTGGLLEHVLSLCRAACSLCTHYSKLNRDLLIAGCLLHDIGKTKELSPGVSIEYSTAGRLVGHVAEGLAMLEDACRGIEGFPEHTRMLLRHLVASHHGSYEFGALKLPMTPEAIALSFLDDFDAKLDFAFRAIEGAAGAAFSPYDRALQREIYCVRDAGEAGGGGSEEPGGGAGPPESQ